MSLLLSVLITFSASIAFADTHCIDLFSRKYSSYIDSEPTTLITSPVAQEKSIPKEIVPEVKVETNPAVIYNPAPHVFPSYSFDFAKPKNIKTAIETSEKEIRQIEGEISSITNKLDASKRAEAKQAEEDLKAAQRAQEFKPIVVPINKVKQRSKGLLAQFLDDLSGIVEFHQPSSYETSKIPSESEKPKLYIPPSKSIKNKDILSSEERAHLENQKEEWIEMLSAIKSRLAQQKINLQNSERDSLVLARQELKRVITEDPLISSAVYDLLSHYALDNIPSTMRVTLLIGGREGAMILSNPKALEDFTQFIRKLTDRNYLIVFEGESPVASMIVSLAGDRAIPVFDSHAKAQGQQLSSNSVSIENDYIRMRDLSKSEAVIITPDSISGIGMAIEGLATHVLNLEKTYNNKILEEWNSELRMGSRNLGVSLKETKRVSTLMDIIEKSSSFKTYESLGSSLYRSTNLAQINKENKFFRFKVDNITFGSIERIAKEALDMAKVFAQNINTGGAVVFGSSRHDPKSAALIYESSYDLGRLGYAVSTGGAGGAMELSNLGAYNGGGLSIGIPIGGRGSLIGERSVNSNQNYTIVTSDYNERIPSLLGDGSEARKLVIFAPGGGGTLKELATTLVRLTKEDNHIEKIIFLDSGYYKGLYEWLLQLPLPPSISAKFFLADSRSDLKDLGKLYQNDLERSRITGPVKGLPDYSSVKSRFEYTPPPKPPKEDKPWRSEEAIYDDYGGYGGGYGSGESAYTPYKPSSGSNSGSSSGSSNKKKKKKD